MKTVQVSSLTLYDPDAETLRLLQEAKVIWIKDSGFDTWRLKNQVKNLGPSPNHTRVIQISVGELIAPVNDDVFVVDKKFYEN